MEIMCALACLPSSSLAPFLPRLLLYATSPYRFLSIHLYRSLSWAIVSHSLFLWLLCMILQWTYITLFLFLTVFVSKLRVLHVSHHLPALSLLWQLWMVLYFSLSFFSSLFFLSRLHASRMSHLIPPFVLSMFSVRFFVLVVGKVGLPSDKAQYIHRLGRTARAGKAGRGILLLCDFEWVSRDACLPHNPLGLFYKAYTNSARSFCSRGNRISTQLYNTRTV